MPEAVHIDTGNPSRRRFMIEGTVVATAIPFGAGVAVAADSAVDAGLLALGREMERLWIAEVTSLAAHRSSQTPESEAASDAASEATSAIVERIADLPARTPEGLRVKARAVAWCNALEGGTFDIEYGGETTDIRLAMSMVRDILGL